MDIQKTEENKNEETRQDELVYTSSAVSTSELPDKTENNSDPIGTSTGVRKRTSKGLIDNIKRSSLIRDLSSKSLGERQEELKKKAVKEKRFSREESDDVFFADEIHWKDENGTKKVVYRTSTL
jgi:hypothetical protein